MYNTRCEVYFLLYVSENSGDNSQHDRQQSQSQHQLLSYPSTLNPKLQTRVLILILVPVLRDPAALRKQNSQVPGVLAHHLVELRAEVRDLQILSQGLGSRACVTTRRLLRLYMGVEFAQGLAFLLVHLSIGVQALRTRVAGVACRLCPSQARQP